MTAPNPAREIAAAMLADYTSAARDCATVLASGASDDFVRAGIRTPLSDAVAALRRLSSTDNAVTLPHLGATLTRRGSWCRWDDGAWVTPWADRSEAASGRPSQQPCSTGPGGSAGSGLPRRPPRTWTRATRRRKRTSSRREGLRPTPPRSRAQPRRTPGASPLARAHDRGRVLVYVPACGTMPAHVEVVPPPSPLDTPIRVVPADKAEAWLRAEEDRT